MMAKSPSSVRWHGPEGEFKTHHPFDDFLTENDDDRGLSEAWKLPSEEEMQRRLAFRNAIRVETLQHRRIHRHGGNVGGRNIAHVLQSRQRSGRQDLLTEEIRTFAEYCSVTRYHSSFLKHLGGEDPVSSTGLRPSCSEAVSTISVAFSPDSATMASAHGDHTIKITCTLSGGLLQSLEGHPRTPWTVKYHPWDPHIVASGCLGHQVRLWNWKAATCLHMIRLEYSIISLSFHPTGKVLAIANGTRLHFWSMETLITSSSSSGLQGNSGVMQHTYPSQLGQTTATNSSSNQRAPPRDQTTTSRRGALTEVEHHHMLRCVHFPPDGSTMIVGGVHPSSQASRRAHGASFYLKLYDFDLGIAINPSASIDSEDGRRPQSRRGVMANPRTIVHRALLYNDGGFDVSPDGKTICACAEYWLPDGIDSAMDLLYGQGSPDDFDEMDSDLDDNSDDGKSEGVENIRSVDESRSTPEPSVQGPLTSGTMESPPRANTSLPVSSSEFPVHNLLQPRTANPLTPQTPPASAIRSDSSNLSPPSPPGRRLTGMMARRAHAQHTRSRTGMNPGHGGSAAPTTPTTQRSAAEYMLPGPPPPPRPGSSQRHQAERTYPNNGNGNGTLATHGRFVPHVVTISLDTTPVEAGDEDTGMTSPTATTNGPSRRSTKHQRRRRPRLGQLLDACPLDGAKATAVTCVKFSPSTAFLLIGYGVREPMMEANGSSYHPVASLYRVKGGMTHVSTLLSADDDVNIARFHPQSGYGFVFGTKQGRVKVCSPRPWNFYNC